MLKTTQHHSNYPKHPSNHTATTPNTLATTQNTIATTEQHPSNYPKRFIIVVGSFRLNSSVTSSFCSVLKGKYELYFSLAWCIQHLDSLTVQCASLPHLCCTFLSDIYTQSEMNGDAETQRQTCRRTPLIIPVFTKLTVLWYVRAT